MPDHNRNSRFPSSHLGALAVDFAAAQLLATLLGRVRDPSRRKVLREALEWLTDRPAA